MYLPKESITMPNTTYVRTDRFFQNSKSALIDICAIKTSLLPTVKIEQSGEVLCPEVTRRNGQAFLTNKYRPVKSILEDEFLFVPKIKNQETSSINRHLAWLYGKYVANGYFKSNTIIPQIIVPVKKISNKEEQQLRKLFNHGEVLILPSKQENYKKVIIIKNANTVSLFKNTEEKTLKPFITKAKASIFNAFVYSLLLECENDRRLELDNPLLAHEIFIHTYSKTEKILKVTEERTGKKKPGSKKKVYIQQASASDFQIIGDRLYTRVIQNRLGKGTSGIDTDTSHLFGPDIIYNSLVVRNPEFVID